MTDPATAWLNALAFLAGYSAAELQHRIRAHLRSLGPPRGSYGLPPDHDWRRSFNHENTAPNSSEERPRKFRRTVRLDEGRIQRGNGTGGPTTPKPEFPPPRVIREDFLP